MPTPAPKADRAALGVTEVCALFARTHARTHALTHPYTKVTGLQIDGPIDEVVRTSKRQSTRACSSQRQARIASGPAGFSQWNDELGE